MRLNREKVNAINIYSRICFRTFVYNVAIYIYNFIEPDNFRVAF